MMPKSPALSDQVFCHSGYEYAERPIAFIWQGQRLEIAAIQAGWQKPGFKCFRVTTTDEQVFDLCYDQTADQWLIQQP
jgi:hypothetical protein